MKKIIVALFITFALAASSFANNSDDIYVRKDVFDVHIQNINLNLERISNRLDKIEVSINELSKAVAVLSERTDRNFETLSARIDSNNSRIDDLRNGLYLWLVVIGTFLAWPKAKNLIQNMHSKRDSQKQSLTLEDIEKLIDARINSKFRS